MVIITSQYLISHSCMILKRTKGCKGYLYVVSPHMKMKGYNICKVTVPIRSLFASQLEERFF